MSDEDDTPLKYRKQRNSKRKTSIDDRQRKCEDEFSDFDEDKNNFQENIRNSVRKLIIRRDSDGEFSCGSSNEYYEKLKKLYQTGSSNNCNVESVDDIAPRLPAPLHEYNSEKMDKILDFSREHVLENVTDTKKTKLINSETMDRRDSTKENFDNSNANEIVDSVNFNQVISQEPNNHQLPLSSLPTNSIRYGRNNQNKLGETLDFSRFDETTFEKLISDIEFNPEKVNQLYNGMLRLFPPNVSMFNIKMAVNHVYEFLNTEIKNRLEKQRNSTNTVSVDLCDRSGADDNNHDNQPVVDESQNNEKLVVVLKVRNKPESGKSINCIEESSETGKSKKNNVRKEVSDTDSEIEYKTSRKKRRIIESDSGEEILETQSITASYNSITSKQKQVLSEKDNRERQEDNSVKSHKYKPAIEYRIEFEKFRERQREKLKRRAESKKRTEPRDNKSKLGPISKSQEKNEDVKETSKTKQPASNKDSTANQDDFQPKSNSGSSKFSNTDCTKDKRAQINNEISKLDYDSTKTNIELKKGEKKKEFIGPKSVKLKRKSEKNEDGTIELIKDLKDVKPSEQNKVELEKNEMQKDTEALKLISEELKNKSQKENEDTKKKKVESEKNKKKTFVGPMSVKIKRMLEEKDNTKISAKLDKGETNKELKEVEVHSDDLRNKSNENDKKATETGEELEKIEKNKELNGIKRKSDELKSKSKKTKKDDRSKIDLEKDKMNNDLKDKERNSDELRNSKESDKKATKTSKELEKDNRDKERNSDELRKSKENDKKATKTSEELEKDNRDKALKDKERISNELRKSKESDKKATKTSKELEKDNRDKELKDKMRNSDELRKLKEKAGTKIKIDVEKDKRDKEVKVTEHKSDKLKKSHSDGKIDVEKNEKLGSKSDDLNRVKENNKKLKNEKNKDDTVKKEEKNKDLLRKLHKTVPFTIVVPKLSEKMFQKYFKLYNKRIKSKNKKNKILVQKIPVKDKKEINSKNVCKLPIPTKAAVKQYNFSYDVKKVVGLPVDNDSSSSKVPVNKDQFDVGAILNQMSASFPKKPAQPINTPSCIAPNRTSFTESLFASKIFSRTTGLNKGAKFDQHLASYRSNFIPTPVNVRGEFRYATPRAYLIENLNVARQHGIKRLPGSKKTRNEKPLDTEKTRWVLDEQCFCTKCCSGKNCNKSDNFIISYDAWEYINEEKI